jgi:RNA polymerase sigma-70 factor (sigma-E family)
MSDDTRHAERAETWSADDAVTQLYAVHYRTLVRLAALLLHDAALAEDVVQDAFVAMHGAWRRLRDPDRALAYLRRAVVNRSRSALRRRAVAERFSQSAPPEAPSAEAEMLIGERHREVIRALRRLPRRQREVLVLRYYIDLSEADTAETLGISRGAVKSHTSRGMAALRTSLEGLS